jgi:hypothetical protein
MYNKLLKFEGTAEKVEEKDLLEYGGKCIASVRKTALCFLSTFHSFFFHFTSFPFQQLSCPLLFSKAKSVCSFHRKFKFPAELRLNEFWHAGKFLTKGLRLL